MLKALKGRNRSNVVEKDAMSQSLVKNWIHLVYSTKHREPWIPKEHQQDLYAYQAGIFKKWRVPQSSSWELKITSTRYSRFRKITH